MIPTGATIEHRVDAMNGDSLFIYQGETFRVDRHFLATEHADKIRTLVLQHFFGNLGPPFPRTPPIDFKNVSSA